MRVLRAHVFEAPSACQHKDAGIRSVASSYSSARVRSSWWSSTAQGLAREAVARPGFDLRRPESWVELLADADVALEADRQAGETTAVVMAISDRGVVGASACDSGAWIIGADVVDDLTAGQHRKLRLGSARSAPVSFSRAKLEGTLLVATDGLFNYARAEDIAAVVRQDDLERAVHELVQLVRLPAGGLQDDMGAVLVRGGI